MKIAGRSWSWSTFRRRRAGASGHLQTQLMPYIVLIAVLNAIAIPNVARDQNEAADCVVHLLEIAEDPPKKAKECPVAGEPYDRTGLEKVGALRCPDPSDHLPSGLHIEGEPDDWAVIQNLPPAREPADEWITFGAERVKVRRSGTAVVVERTRRWWVRYLFGALFLLIALYAAFSPLAALGDVDSVLEVPAVLGAVGIYALVCYAVPVSAGVEWVCGGWCVEIPQEGAPVRFQKTYFGMAVTEPRVAHNCKALFPVEIGRRSVDVMFAYKDEGDYRYRRLFRLPKEKMHLVSFLNEALFPTPLEEGEGEPPGEP